jgi:hypothetical protein
VDDLNECGCQGAGAARLPNLELIRVAFLNPDGKAFKGDHTSEYRNLSGWEGGLAPLFDQKNQVRTR